jgi:hypothetical protein
MTQTGYEKLLQALCKLQKKIRADDFSSQKENGNPGIFIPSILTLKLAYLC